MYIDLNMVRAGIVNHPVQWKQSGFCEIQEPPKCYAVIDLQSLIVLSGFMELRDFQSAQRKWIEEALECELAMRDGCWSETIAVGSLPFVEKVKYELGVKATHREVVQADGTYALREPTESYAGKLTGGNEVLSAENTVLWNESVENAET